VIEIHCDVMALQVESRLEIIIPIGWIIEGWKRSLDRRTKFVNVR
jgi:hypothetical protein